jgi:hypothetical protein
MSDVEVGQSFYNDSIRYLNSCKFYLKKVGSPTGNAYAKLYAHSGTFGSSSTGTGEAIATSGAVDVSTLGTSYSLIEFTFTGANKILLSADTNYVIVVSYYGTDSSNYISIGSDESSPVHSGNACGIFYEFTSYEWWYHDTKDTIFYLYSTSSISERGVYTTGKLTNNSERLIHTTGGGVTGSSRGIYTTSGAADSERGIYTEAKAQPVGIPFYETEKKYSVKIYDRAGTTFKGNYDPIGGYSFTKNINAGVGELSITLPRKFDDYGLGDDVNLLDEIQIWVQDRDSSGEKIYSGYVSGITSYINGDEQGIVLDVLGYVSRLGMTLDWDGTNISMVRNSQTPGEIAKDVIDKYRTTVAEERINYGSATVDIAGTDISYTSNAKSCLETIERVRQMAGATWYWYVDAENVFYFDSYPTTPTHLFVFGKDVSSIEINRNVDSLKNEFIFWNGLQPDDTHFLSTRYYNTASITSYWNRFENLTDGRITDDATADEFASAFINAYKDPNVSMKFEVKDNNLGQGYDIESIEPGHTCKILNLDDSSVVGSNMVITSVNYTPEKAIIYVSDLREITGRSLTNLRRQLDTTVYGDRPVNLTSEAIT